MIKVPLNSEFKVQNGPETKPNIAYTKNVDFDQEGYIKLSPPMPTLTDDTATAAFGHFVDIFNYDFNSYKAITDDGIFDIELDDLTVTLDAAAPSGETESRVAGFQSTTWIMNAGGDIWATDGTTWTKRNDDTVDFFESFVSRNTWAGAVSGGVQQYAIANLDDSPLSTTSTGPDLVIPSFLTPTGQAYSNYRLGIATANRQQGNAFFFTWDGTSASAGQGVPVDAPAIIDVCSYQNSWALLTSRGQLLYFNGGGFDVLANLPVYYFSESWLDTLGSDQFGKILNSDSDIIYINIGSRLEGNSDDSGILNGFYSGVLCYDPAVGLYHRYGLSHSHIMKQTLTPTANVYTSTGNHYLLTGDIVVFDGIVKYAIKVDATNFKVASTYDAAIAGTNDTVSGADTINWIARTDWCQAESYNNLFGCVKKIDNSYTTAQGWIPTFAGGGLSQKDMTFDSTINILAPIFENVGTICYYKMMSSQIEDLYQSVIVKYKSLSDGDKIVVKYKLADGYKQIAVGEAGDSTPDVYITWTDANTFTTTKDLTQVEVGDEVEFFAGAGGGSTAHISSLSEAAGTWTVNLDEDIRGGESGNKSTCRFDSFKKLGVITKDTVNQAPGQALLRLNKTSKAIQVKLELRGRDITIEELIVNNQTQKDVV